MKPSSNRTWMMCIFACLACLSGIACLASAAESDSLRAKFESYDTDHDGKVTATELPAPKAFQQLDRNSDGAITLSETRSAAEEGLLRGLKLPPPRAARVASPKTGDRTARSDVREAPKRLKAGGLGIGKRIEDLEFTDVDGNQHKLSDFQDAKAVVIAMTGTGCPLCLKYAPTLAAIEHRYRDQQVRFVWLNPNESENLARVRNAIEANGLDGPYVRDLEEHITSSLGVKTTTEVFLIDAARTLCYRGAVDDQYGFGYSLESPRNNYLTDAIDAVISGERPLVAATSAPGCEMFYSREGKIIEKGSVENTYHNRISRILMNHCVDCHREGGSAPFALQTYESVRDYSQMISRVVHRRIMPPWFAAENGSEMADREETGGSAVAGANSKARGRRGDSPAVAAAAMNDSKLHWSNDPTLSQADRNDLLAWIDAGTVEGNSSDGPLERNYPDEWEIGKPDLQLQIPKAIAIKATGIMPYQKATIELSLDEDQWVQAVEIRPTAAAVVHHVLVFVKDAMKNDGIDEEAGFFAAYVPGNTFQVYADGFAKKLPAKSELVLQLHYTPNGTATSDQTRVGIRFASKPPKRIIRNAGIANRRISIPPHAPNHREQASLRVPSDVRLLSFMPHMHLRGKAFRYDVVFPNGEKERLLSIPQYDFNWQLEYRLAEPLDVPRGSRIDIQAWYDNTDGNPANPDSSKTVKWGPQTEDEMMLGYVEYVRLDEELGDRSN